MYLGSHYETSYVLNAVFCEIHLTHYYKMIHGYCTNHHPNVVSEEIVVVAHNFVVVDIVRLPRVKT